MWSSMKDRIRLKKRSRRRTGEMDTINLDKLEKKDKS